MEKITLRNVQRESLIIAIIVFALSGVLFYWATQGGFELRIYGADVDEDTSIALMYLISIFPFTYGIIRLSYVFSARKLRDDFVIKIDYEHISYPVPAGRFKGYNIAKTQKRNILYAKAFNTGNHEIVIYLKDHDHDIIGVIPYHEICDNRKITSEDLEKKINDWLDNYDIIDPSLF
jgi:hypothetical protein